MMHSSWTVVLAAGAGRRLASLTGNVPKQFWRMGSRPSLLEDTTDRFAPIASRSRTIVVVDRRHRDYVAACLDMESVAGASFIFQPEDRGTAAGVLLGLLPVLEADPNAVVTITPADHGVEDDERFRRGVVEAVQHVGTHGGVVLFGVEPTEAHDDYGWITPGSPTTSQALRSVAAFVEKPPADRAQQLLASGSVWNTMVVVARASAVHGLYREFLPQLANVFGAALRMPARARAAFLGGAYPMLATADFCRDLLTPARNLSTYIWPASVGWSDLGTPERLRAWQQRAA